MSLPPQRGTTIVRLINGKWTAQAPATFPLRRFRLMPNSKPEDVALAFNQGQDELQSATVGSRDIAATVSTRYVAYSFKMGALYQLPHYLGAPPSTPAQSTRPPHVELYRLGAPAALYVGDPRITSWWLTKDGLSVVLVPAGTFVANIEFALVP